MTKKTAKKHHKGLQVSLQSHPAPANALCRCHVCLWCVKMLMGDLLQNKDVSNTDWVDVQPTLVDKNLNKNSYTAGH